MKTFHKFIVTVITYSDYSSHFSMKYN